MIKLTDELNMTEQNGHKDWNEQKERRMSKDCMQGRKGGRRWVEKGRKKRWPQSGSSMQ